jgi:hypothetical protein
LQSIGGTRVYFLCSPPAPSLDPWRRRRLFLNHITTYLMRKVMAKVWKAVGRLHKLVRYVPFAGRHRGIPAKSWVTVCRTPDLLALCMRHCRSQPTTCSFKPNRIAGFVCWRASGRRLPVKNSFRQSIDRSANTLLCRALESQHYDKLTFSERQFCYQSLIAAPSTTRLGF